ncbi:hypothetical protein J1N35_038459 [Gossypium stocksii]|uniref:RNase H type-1 domain-containing protein n=1 Tax=Gossypium stocksii TaxID=47602 RepID=A0A9D3ZMW4_9ROSI|nr:hypothetical protein J1N35_038459 [Gossypium stocksii]
MAKLWGMLDGHWLVWNLRLKKVILETNTEETIQAIQEAVKEQHGFSVICSIKELLQRDWTICFIHIFKEANKVVDGLAKMTFSRPLGKFISMQPPNEVLQSLHDDLSNIV